MSKSSWILLILVLLGVFLYQISGILLPFVLAFILAYALDPVVDKCTRRIPRSVMSGIVVIGVVFLCVSMVLILVPILQAQVMEFVLRIPNLVQLVWEKLKDVLTYGRENMTDQQLYRLSDSVSETALNVFQGVGGALRRLISGSMAVFSLASLLLITPVVLFYLLRDWPQISNCIKEVIPMKKRPMAQSLLQEINVTLSGFIRGQASVCLILAIYYATGLSLVGLDMSVLVGLMTGILIFIPYIGFGIGLLFSILLGILPGLTTGQWLWLGGVFLFGQILEGYFLTPYLVGKKVGLHPVWIIFVLLVGGITAGPLGVLLAVPVAAVCGVIIRRLLAWYRTTTFYKGRNDRTTGA